MGFGECSCIDDWLATESTVRKLQAHPARQIARAGTGAAGRGLRVRVPRGQCLPFASDGDMERGAIAACQKVAMAGTGGRHAQPRIEPVRRRPPTCIRQPSRQPPRPRSSRSCCSQIPSGSCAPASGGAHGGGSRRGKSRGPRDRCRHCWTARCDGRTGRGPSLRRWDSPREDEHPASRSAMRVSHVTFRSPTRAATTVAASGFESEASWKTVSSPNARLLVVDPPEAVASQVDELVAMDNRDRQAGDRVGLGEPLRHSRQLHHRVQHIVPADGWRRPNRCRFVGIRVRHERRLQKPGRCGQSAYPPGQQDGHSIVVQP